MQNQGSYVANVEGCVRSDHILLLSLSKFVFKYLLVLSKGFYSTLQQYQLETTFTLLRAALRKRACKILLCENS